MARISATGGQPVGVGSAAAHTGKHAGSARGLMGHVEIIDDEVIDDEDLLKPTLTPPDPLFAGLPTISDGMWVAKRGLSMFFHNVVTERSRATVKLIKSVNRDHSWVEDFGPVMVCSRDIYRRCQEAMVDAEIPGKAALTFGFDLRTSWNASAHTYIPVPDSGFQNWVEAGVDDFERASAELRQVGHKSALKNLAGWMGNNQTYPTHSRLSAIAAAKPHLLESNEMPWRRADEVDSGLLPADGAMSLANLISTYAYIVDLKASSYSQRQKLLMHSGRTILRQDHPWSEYYYPSLKPFVHYVPVAEDLHDLADKIMWLQGNPKIAQKIGANAQRFAKRHLTRAAAELVWAQALQRIAHMPAVNTTKPRSVGELQAVA